MIFVPSFNPVVPERRVLILRENWITPEELTLPKKVHEKFEYIIQYSQLFTA